MRRVIDRLLCIFPFEEAFFREHGVQSTYIGHPLATRVRPALSREEFFRKHNLDPGSSTDNSAPGSRRSEALRHLPELVRAADNSFERPGVELRAARFAQLRRGFFREPLAGSSIQPIEGKPGMPSRTVMSRWRQAAR